MSSKKKILIFAHYYYPDVASTGQIIKEQAEWMLDEFDVTVICTVPSYGGTIEDKYKRKKYYIENINNVKIIRIRVPEFAKNNKISRIKNIVSYFFSALSVCKKTGKQDYVFTISQPPILGGLLGVRGKRMKKAKMIYCIQDFNPEQVIAVGYFHNKLVLKVMLALDKYSCWKSDLVITVGRDLVQTLKCRFEGKSVPNHVMINNWVDEKEIHPLCSDHNRVQTFRKKHGLDDKFVFMYSGNMGLYYDLENLIKVIEKFKNSMTADGRNIVFAFIGAGSVRDKLFFYTKEHEMNNVTFIPYQDKEDLNYSLNAADVHWCVNAKGIKGVSCPSKFYGIAACSKPVLGVLESESEIRMLIEETGCGLVSEPGEYKIVEENIQKFLEIAGSNKIEKMGKAGFDYLSERLTKDISVGKYVEVIKAL